MAEKNIASRIVHKHDTEANWIKATNFIPKKGEIIVYDVDTSCTYERFKIGDGTTKVNSLPFADANKMDKNNPTGTGSFSMHRKGDTDIGLYSVAIGYNNTASGKYSEAHGYNTTSTNEGSHAEGHSTMASGYASHAEGLSTKALAGYAHAEGYYTTADAMAAHTEGCYTKAIGAYQHVQGQYNITNSTYAHIVGNGTDENNRSNAHTLKWDGTAWFAGDVKIGGSGQDDTTAKTLATTDYVDAATQLENIGIYIGPDEPTNQNVKVWINTSEEGTGVVPLLPRIATVTLKASSWTGSNNPYSQVVAVNGVTVNSKIDLQPTAQQIVSLQSDDIALMAENNGGTVTFYALGGKPSVDYTMQVLLTEVAYV